MNLKEMLARQQAILDKAKAEQRDLNTEEEREFNQLQTNINALRAAGGSEPSNQNQEPPVNVDDLQRQAREAERQRTLDIQALCRNFGYDATEYIEQGKSMDEVRALILEKQIKERSPSAVGITQDEGDKFRDAARDGLAMRAGVQVDKPAAGANEMRHMSLRELAIETLRLEGTHNASRMNNDDLLRQYLTPTGMFAGIMDQTARTVFEKAYTDAQTTYQLWTKKGTLRDFRPTKTYSVGTAGELLLVPQGGELKHDAPNAEDGPQRQLLTFGRQFSMTREAFINDDVDFISAIPALYAQSARLGINRLVYQMLAKNPAIWDGKQLFSADHGNISSVAGAPSVEALSDMRQKMKKQKATGGEVNLNIPAKFMLLPTTLETKGGQLLGSTVDPSQANPNIPNPFYNSLSIISDAELDDASNNGEKEWYVTADQMRSPIQVDYLNGVDMPTIVMKQAPAGQLGFLWDIYIDYGVTVVDYKTVVKNNGQ